MSNPLFNIQYGLFVITTCDAGKDNGCISNTVAQVTAQPNRISVALNKGNFTTEIIQRSGKFTASDFVKVTVAEPDASTTNKYAGTRTEKNLEAML